LWPETIYAGLFPGRCWLRRGGTDLAMPDGFEAGGTPEQLLRTLDAMLSQHAQAIRKGARLHVLVSDSVSVLVTMPWQEELTSQDELTAYAHACFEQQGLDLDAQWTVQTGFRRHRASGIAFGVRSEWLRALADLIAGHGHRLVTALPVSAAAYWRHSVAPGSGAQIVVLREAQRITALVWTSGQLQGVDVEPVVGVLESAGTRLMRRVCAAHPAVSGAACWIAEREPSSAVPAFIAACLHDGANSAIARDQWA
jgi:hypothetical protein